MDISSRGYLNSHLLWSPELLAKKLNASRLAIIDMRPAELYANGHLPGAKHFDPYFVNIDDTDDAPLKAFTRMWAEMLGWRGVGDTDTIVFYGEFTDMCAARGFWFAEFLGHSDVHVLDGGFRCWIEGGFPTATACRAPKPSKFKFKAVNDKVATYIDVLEAIDNPNSVIIDTRSQQEFLGNDRRARRGGAIPTAKHRDWEDLFNHSSGCMKSAEDLRWLFESLDACPEKEVIVYCNTGYRSAHAYLALRLLNYPRVRNYVGSWQEWGNRDTLPVETWNGLKNKS